MTGGDFALTAGWGHFGQGDAVMPGQGRTAERTYTPDERTTLGESAQTLGETLVSRITSRGGIQARERPPTEC